MVPIREQRSPIPGLGCHGLFTRFNHGQAADEEVIDCNRDVFH